MVKIKAGVGEEKASTSYKDLKAQIEAYKKASPAKYERRKDEFDAQLAALK
jgi:hypothetical protein